MMRLASLVFVAALMLAQHAGAVTPQQALAERQAAAGEWPHAQEGGDRWNATLEIDDAQGRRDNATTILNGLPNPDPNMVLQVLLQIASGDVYLYEDPGFPNATPPLPPLPGATKVRDAGDALIVAGDQLFGAGNHAGAAQKYSQARIEYGWSRTKADMADPYYDEAIRIMGGGMFP